MNPFISVMIHGELFIYQTKSAIDYETYHQIKAIAEDQDLYLGNPSCVNPSVLAFEFVRHVQEQTGVQLVSAETWPVVTIHLKGENA